jgi:hypothetical protein
MTEDPSEENSMAQYASKKLKLLTTMMLMVVSAAVVTSVVEAGDWPHWHHRCQ